MTPKVLIIARNKYISEFSGKSAILFGKISKNKSTGEMTLIFKSGIRDAHDFGSIENAQKSYNQMKSGEYDLSIPVLTPSIFAYLESEGFAIEFLVEPK